MEITDNLVKGTPTKRQVSKRLKRQVYKTSGFTKCQVLQNVRSLKRPVAKKTSIYILCLLLVEIRRFCCSHVCRQSESCVLFFILEGFFAIKAVSETTNR